MHCLPLSRRAKGRSDRSPLHFHQLPHTHLSMPALCHPPHLLIALFRLSLPNHPSPSLCRLLTTQSPFPFHSNDEPSPPPPSKDEYFAAVHHISHIVCRNFYLERTLHNFPIVVTSDLVYRVLRACSNAPIPSFRFFAWAGLGYAPTVLEFEELICTLGRPRLWEHMWKAAEQMKSLSLPLSPDTFSALIHSYMCSRQGQGRSRQGRFARTRLDVRPIIRRRSAPNPSSTTGHGCAPDLDPTAEGVVC